MAGTENRRAGADTGERSQELHDPSETGAAELLIESGAVLRLSEADAAALSQSTAGTEDETMIINMGPQHPSTHGVLRLMLELQGETVLRT
ncbi:MAG: nuoD, partial [Acidimicrobiales bacterium]|nr:nuoD [Acidimicrobiales bacterium]